MQHFVDHFEDTPVVVLACLIRYRPENYAEGSSVFPAVQNLMLAARRGHHEAVEVLVRGGANASAQLVALMPQLSEEPPLQAQAIDCCIDLLKANNPAAALQALRGLICCGAAAVEPLLNSLDERNYGARAWTVRALSAIQDPRGLEVLQRAVANDIGPSVRQAAAYGLGRLQGHDENVLRPCMESLELACSDSEWSVRYAAVAALEQGEAHYRHPRAREQRERD